MNAELISILNQYGQSTVEKIRENLESTGTNATGKTSKSLRYEVKNEGTKATLKVIGKPYLAVVETGRKPTPQYDNPSVEFVASIKEWVKAKGLPEGSAYAIAKSIHKKGTELFRKGGRKDIVSSVINQSLVDKISLDLLDKFAIQFLANAVKLFRDGSDNFGASSGTGT